MILKNFNNKIPHFHLWLIIFEIGTPKLVLFEASAGQNLETESETLIKQWHFSVSVQVYITNLHTDGQMEY